MMTIVLLMEYSRSFEHAPPASFDKLSTSEVVIASIAGWAFTIFLAAVMICLAVYFTMLMIMGMKMLYGIVTATTGPVKVAFDPKRLEHLRKDTERLLNAQARKENMYGSASSQPDSVPTDDLDIDLEYHRMGSR